MPDTFSVRTKRSEAFEKVGIAFALERIVDNDFVVVCVGNRRDRFKGAPHRSQPHHDRRGIAKLVGPQRMHRRATVEQAFLLAADRMHGDALAALGRRGKAQRGHDPADPRALLVFQDGQISRAALPTISRP